MGRAILRKRVLQASIFRGSVNFCEIRQPFPRLPAWSWLQNRNTYGKTIQEAKPTETELGKSPCLEVHAPGSPLEKPTFRTCYKTRIGPFHHWVRHTKSRCRYLDMFLTICLKKRHSSSIRIILHTKMSPKEISKHEDLPTCFDRFVQFSWEMRRDPRNIGNACTSMSFTVLCVISSLQNKENPKKQKKTRKTTKTELQKAMYHYSVLTIGSMTPVNICLTIYPYKIQPFMDRKIYFTTVKFFAKSMGFIPGSIPVAKPPRVNLYQIG